MKDSQMITKNIKRKLSPNKEILANKNLWDLCKKGKITEQDVADVLGTPLDYVRWLKKKIFRED